MAATEADIGAALGQRDAADHDAVGRVDHDPVEFGIAHAPAAPQIAVDVAAHAVGRAGAGVDVAKRAAPTVKRVSQELGGKSPNVILEGADLQKAVTGGVMHMFNNSGQSCNAPTRMIVPLSKMKEVAAIAKGVADKTKAGDPRAEGTTIAEPTGSSK